MKKWIESSIAVLCISFLAACGGGGGTPAQEEKEEESVVGKWKAQNTKLENGGNVEMVMNLDMKEDKTMSLNVSATMNGEEKGLKLRIPMSMGFDGQWETNANKMIFNPDTATSYFSINKDSIIIDIDNPKLEMMANVVKEALVKEFEKRNTSNLTMVKFMTTDSMSYFFDKSQLVIVSDKDTVKFNKE